MATDAATPSFTAKCLPLRPTDTLREQRSMSGMSIVLELRVCYCCEMLRILIVEDEVTNLEVASVICEAAGHEVSTARNGIEALERLEKQEFDAVLVDYLMPEMDGLALIQRLRAESKWRDLPLLAVTAMASNADQSAMMAAGANAVLTKPFKNRELINAIASVIEIARGCAADQS
jgi:CheY-like chemotaxis protein